MLLSGTQPAKPLEAARLPQLCIMILSVKSSGSSIVQRELASSLSARLLERTPHAENETLFWTKAASILGLPQEKMANSEVPLPRWRARRMLRKLLRENLPGVSGPLRSQEDIFAAWTALVRAGDGVFVEKSPHHLYQPSALALMRRYADAAKDVDVRFIGLVRNPIDTLYSSWRRFGVRPEVEERHWIRAYSLLRDFHAERPDIVTLVRYEDLVVGKIELAALMGLPAGKAGAGEQGFHARSIQKWRADRSFGYRPSARLIELAGAYGYAPEEVENPNAFDWRVRAAPRTALWWLFSSIPRRTQERIKALVKPIVGGRT